MKRTALFILLTLSYFSLDGTQNKCTLHKKKIPTPVWITVFIHGAIKAEWIFNSLIKVVTDSVEGSTYEKAVSMVRHDPHFFRLHAMQEPGLQKIDITKTSTKRGAHAIAYIYDQITAEAQHNPTINYYYTFGWSGLMSSSQRFHESEQLYDELTQEIQRISKKHHITPHIRLIAYSHGGNVCLNLARAKQKMHQSCFCVDEFILIGSPIQPETDYLIADPMFKKVYNFYSPDDMVQPSDFFSAKGSSRTFKARSTFTLPDKLKQICVKVAHYKPRGTKNALPSIPLDYNKGAIKKSLVNPGHIELWYMGWTSSMYRETFPLYPLPVVDFVSFITTKVDEDPSLKGKIIVTVNAQQEIMHLKNKHINEKKTVAFLPVQKLETLKRVAQSHKPDKDFYKEHKKRIDDALTFAKSSKNGGLIRVKKPDGSYYKISKSAMCFH